MATLKFQSISMANVIDILIQAGLLNEVQVQVALYDQTSNPHLRLSEILSLRGWIAEETVDFFELLWDMRVRQRDRQLIGKYFMEARLLTSAQVEDVVAEQKLSHLRFGEVAVLKGYLKQETVRFFLKHLFPQNIKVKAISPLARTTQTQAHQRTLSSDVTVQQTAESVNIAKQQHQRQQSESPPPNHSPRQPSQHNFLNRLKQQVQHKLAEVNPLESRSSKSQSPKSQPPKSQQRRSPLPQEAVATSYDLSDMEDEDFGDEDFGLDDL